MIWRWAGNSPRLARLRELVTELEEWAAQQDAADVGEHYPAEMDGDVEEIKIGRPAP